MAGIYFHIPFCKTRCTYCDFFTQTNQQDKVQLITAMKDELEIRQNFLPNPHIHTIYFGGGTPSQLSPEEINDLLRTTSKHYSIDQEAEITLEANPDDLNQDYLLQLRNIGINRLSIGIQSFHNDELKKINRRHSSEEAIHTVKMAQEIGFQNISIDLIYGLPRQTIERWKQNLFIAFSLSVQHISAYGLTYEKNTQLWKQRQRNIVKECEEETMNQMFSILIDQCKENGFEHYEVSNFALKGRRSQHNSAYWKLHPYLGVGAAAHSYNGILRQWNASSITQYIENMRQTTPVFDNEKLSNTDKYNDYIMVRLRTKEGINLDFLRENMGKEAFDYCLKNAKRHIDNHNLSHIVPFLSLTQKGLFISNQIIIDLLNVE